MAYKIIHREVEPSEGWMWAYEKLYIVVPEEKVEATIQEIRQYYILPFNIEVLEESYEDYQEANRAGFKMARDNNGYVSGYLPPEAFAECKIEPNV